MKLVRRTDITEDLLQDAIVKIWKHIDSFDPAKGTLFTWMLNIARNHAIDYLRSSGYKNQLQNVNMDLLSGQMDYISATTSNIPEVDVKDFKTQALQIESKYSEIIDMIFFYGFTQQQTATMLNLPLGTIKTRARKGLRMLKTLYKK